MTQNPSPIKPDQIEKIQPIGEETEESPSTATPFSSYMQPGASQTPGAATPPSPFELSQQAANVPTTGPTNETLLSQVVQAGSTLGDINNQINYPNLKLGASQKYLLKNKLSDATTLLRSANEKLGVNPGPPPDLSSASGPLGKFISLINDGNDQIAAAKQHVEMISQQGTNINPADMLLIQIKLNKAQQELEFSSILLSKAVDDLKQLMNIQL